MCRVFKCIDNFYLKSFNKMKLKIINLFVPVIYSDIFFPRNSTLLQYYTTMIQFIFY